MVRYSHEQILAALQANGGNQSATARTLGIARSTLQHHLDMIGVTPPDIPTPPKDVLLQDRIKRLEEQLKEAQWENLDEHYIRAKILGIKKAVEEMEAPRWLASPPARSKASQSVPTLLLSDLHWGEVVDKHQMSGVNEYNIEIANRRLDTVVSKAIALLRDSIAGEEYPGFVLCLAGDMVAGDIHEELRETNEGTAVTALLDLLRSLISQITLLANEFGRVYVPCVAGNHGRLTHKPRAKRRNETNLDWLLYQFLKLQFQGDPRIIIDAPTTPELTYKVFNHTYHLCHGDQLGKGGDGIIGAFGPIIRGDHKRRSLQAQLSRPYDTLVHCHYHTYAATRRFIGNGSLVGFDEFAMSIGCGYEVPQQAFWLTHPEHGITFSMPIQAESPKAPEAKSWVSFEEAAR